MSDKQKRILIFTAIPILLILILIFIITMPRSYIQLYSPSENEEQMITLITGREDTKIYEYKVNEKADSFTLYAEVYVYGEKKDEIEIASYKSDRTFRDMKNTRGFVAVEQRMDKLYISTLALDIIGGEAEEKNILYSKNIDIGALLYTEDETLPTQIVWVTDKQKVRNDKDIIIDVRNYSDSANILMNSERSLSDDTKILEESELVIIIKCRFFDSEE